LCCLGSTSEGKLTKKKKVKAAWVWKKGWRTSTKTAATIDEGKSAWGEGQFRGYVVEKSWGERSAAGRQRLFWWEGEVDAGEALLGQEESLRTTRATSEKKNFLKGAGLITKIEGGSNH